MKVTLLGLEFAIGNMGCEALAHAFANLTQKLAGEMNIECEFDAIVFAQLDSILIGEKKVNCIKIKYKSLAFWKKIRKSFKSSDLIVDFTGGDSFSDIYGLKRFLMGSYIKHLAIKSGTPFMLGPQTYGPFNHKWCEKIAGRLIKKSTWAFARDELSKEYAEKISGKTVGLTTDVAFALPFERKKLGNENKIKVGINPSGLLWNGGYSTAKVSINVDYKKYLFEVVDRLYQQNKYDIFLIPHVGTKGCGPYENDFNVIVALKEKYPNCVLVDTIRTPMDAKDIISSMDVFTGARMHATIGAFSSGVATIPFSYSRKFEGLYGSLGYDYVIEACKLSTEVAIEKTVAWIENYSELKQAVDKSLMVVREKQTKFNEIMKCIIKEVC